MIKLIKLSKQYKKQFIDMMDEWTSTKEKIIPYALTRINYQYFDIFINDIEEVETNKVKAPSQLFFCFDTKNNKMLGAVVIREKLNTDLLQRGGHIALGIRPSERNKGYGTLLVNLSINKCKELGINNILMVCDKQNIYSSKTIIKNNGILENEIKIENQIIQRYWIINN